MKLPSFQFYPGDWRKDPNLSRCSHAAKGVWIDLLCLMFESDERGVLATAGSAWSDEDVAQAIGGDKATTIACIEELTLKGVANRNSTGALYSKRMVRDEHKRVLCVEAGKLGGNPTLKGGSKGPPKGGSKGEFKRNQTPSSSYSSSYSSSDREGERARADCGQEVPDLEQAKASVLALGIPAGFVALVHADWTENNGRNAAGVDVPWLAYVKKRWRYEQVDWRSGKHRAQAGSAQAGSGGAAGVGDVLDRERERELKALEREFDARYAPLKERAAEI